MSKFKFKEGQPVYHTPKHTNEAVIAFTVASVNEDGQATELRMESGAPTASESLNIAIQKTGATSGTIGQDGEKILLSHGHKATSPYYSEDRDYNENHNFG